jgi:diguanylate cyclase (GGDEF)-like protein/PAS domain S-box-containing protein
LSQQNFHKLFTIYFIVFGLLISLCGATINYYLQVNEINKSLERKASEIFKIKNENILINAIKNMDNIIKSLANNRVVNEYITSKKSNKEDEVREIFFAIANSNNTIMQTRLLNKDGLEIIRINRDSSEEEPYIVDKSQLQNKSQRDYFKILSKMNKNEIWHSNFDLNIENGKIEVPYKPTFRIGMPIFDKDKFEGIVIINVLLNDLFRVIGNSTIFEHYIIDKNQNYILHPNSQFSFNKYTNIQRDIKEDFPDGLESKEVFSYSLKNILKNEDESIMFLKTKSDYKQELIKDKTNTLIIVFVLTLLLSLIMAIFVSKTPIEIQRKLYKANNRLKEFKSIIDKYVITTTTRPDSTIVEVSSAFEKISGYSKEELLGKEISIIKHPQRDKQIIKELWDTILEQKTWTGIIKNKKKNGEEYWLEQTIIPKINEENKNIENFLSISVDVTDKKELEKIATIDKLTNIYNRRMLDDFLKTEIEIANRHNEDLSLIIVDIDHFKIVNDTFGHLAGDNLLTSISKIILENIRNTDIFGRYGGEEFLIICRKTTKENAFVLAEKLRILIKEFKFDEIGHKTISLGISDFQKSDTVETLFKKADTALYEAKNTGRDKSVIYKVE